MLLNRLFSRHATAKVSPVALNWSSCAWAKTVKASASNAGNPSRYRAELPLEGLVVRRESADWCEARAKLVRPDFAQAIDTHWRKRAIEWNRVDWTRT